MPKSPQSNKRSDTRSRSPSVLRVDRKSGNLTRASTPTTSSIIPTETPTPSYMTNVHDSSTSAMAGATTHIFEMLEALRDQYGVETVLVVTRGNIKQPRFSRVHASRKASRFLRNVVRTDAGQLAEKLEGYIVSGAADHGTFIWASSWYQSLILMLKGGIPHSTVKMKQKEQIKIARDFILNGLIDILREDNMPEDQIPKSMNYKSYETKIVEQCGVVLIGYPGDKGIVNPGELDALMLKELLTRLNDGRCYWKKLNDVASTSRVERHTSSLSSPATPNCERAPASFGTLPPSGTEFEIPTPSSTDLSSSWLKDIVSTNTPPEGDGYLLMAQGYDNPVTEYPSQAAPMLHYEPPSSCLNQEYTMPWQAPDPVAKAMNVLHRAYLEAFISLFPNQMPNMTAPLPSFTDMLPSFSPSSSTLYSGSDTYTPPPSDIVTPPATSPLPAPTPSDVYDSPIPADMPNLIPEHQCFAATAETDGISASFLSLNSNVTSDTNSFPWLQTWQT
ncbi:unnamed protein product [Cyclocybe aegerita]|uniref:Uncharacterized protein n=1 Tax=Cyclocybe aegerita TaxID=1973307 RepID=A0A8S0XQ03_CYCAE|nr:unnamed protein product [Cyclocybe aegerita]